MGERETYLAGGARAGVAVAGAAVAGAGRHGEDSWFKDESLKSYKSSVCLLKAWRNETDEEERKKRMREGTKALFIPFGVLHLISIRAMPIMGGDTTTYVSC
jgi:hypothetical protein